VRSIEGRHSELSPPQRLNVPKMRHPTLSKNAQSSHADHDQCDWSGFRSGCNSRDKPERWIKASYQAGATVREIQSDDLIVEVFECINRAPLPALPLRD
jgi:hypothetical protein